MHHLRRKLDGRFVGLSNSVNVVVKNSAPDKKEKCSISDIYFGLFVALGQNKSDIASTISCCKVVKTLEWLNKKKNNFTGVG